MQAGLTAKIAAADVDPVAQQVPPVVAHRVRRRTIIFVVIGILAYFLGLIAMIPAAALIDESDRVQVGGTIWNGEAVLASSIRVEWVLAPLASLGNGAFSADWHLSGGGNDLAGEASRRGDQWRVANVAGQIDGSLLDAAFPHLPLSCRFTGDVRIDRARLGGGDGQQVLGSLRTGPANCYARQATALPVELPEMIANIGPIANGSGGALMTATGRAHLIEMRLSPQGMLSIWPTQFAVERVPFLAGQRYDTKVD